jgi:hypothetical protein
MRKEEFQTLRKFILVTAALGGLFAFGEANAAPVAPILQPVQATQAHPGIVNVDYYWNHRHWHHRRWEHGHWRYY